MLAIIIGLVVFFGGLYFLKAKMGFDEELIYGLLAGSSFFNMLDGISKIVLGALTLNPGLMLTGLILALLQGFFAHLFAKRGNLIE